MLRAFVALPGGNMKRLVCVLAVVLLLAAACGNRNGGDDENSAPPGQDDSSDAGDGDEGEDVDNGGATDVGITGDEIKIGVIADLTGVVPGLFAAAPEA